MTTANGSGRRRIGANISMLFTDVPLTERFARAARAGFAGVELQFPYDVPAEDLAAAARAAGVEVALINVPVLDGANPMISSVPGAEHRFHDAVAQAKAYARTLKAGAVNVLPGSAIEGVAYETQLATYRANLAHAADAMAEIDVTVVAEPVNTVDRPGMLVATADQMAEVLDGVDRDDLFIQFDIYHAAMMGFDPAVAFAKHAARIGHIQFADAPGRHEPGSGAIDFAGAFAAIDASGYPGWINAEYVPAGRTEDGLGWLEGLATRLR